MWIGRIGFNFIIVVVIWVVVRVGGKGGGGSLVFINGDKCGSFGCGVQLKFHCIEAVLRMNELWGGLEEVDNDFFLLFAFLLYLSSKFKVGWILSTFRTPYIFCRFWYSKFQVEADATSQTYNFLSPVSTNYKQPPQMGFPTSNTQAKISLTNVAL